MGSTEQAAIGLNPYHDLTGMVGLVGQQGMKLTHPSTPSAIRRLAKTTPSWSIGSLTPK